MKSIEKYKKDGATILTWTNDGKNEIDYAKMEGGHILIKLNKLTTSIRLYGINQKIAIVGAKCLHIIGIENITEIIEPSAGNGSFSNQINDCISYDIEPESENIKQQDFLELNLEYKLISLD